MTASLKFHPGLGFALGLALVVAAMLAAPRQGHVAFAADAGMAGCPLAEVALDEGYGLSRVALRPVCRR
jgi:hypothetical protein